MECSLPGSSVHRASQERILQWVAISFSEGSSWLRDKNSVSCVGRQSHQRKPMTRITYLITGNTLKEENIFTFFRLNGLVIFWYQKRNHLILYTLFPSYRFMKYKSFLNLFVSTIETLQLLFICLKTNKKPLPQDFFAVYFQSICRFFLSLVVKVIIAICQVRWCTIFH